MLRDNIFCYNGDFMAKNIIICMDGTGNEIEEKETNILRFYRSLHRGKPDKQVVFYRPGVGTMDNQKLIGKYIQKAIALAGMGFGLGLEDDVLEAYRFICRHFEGKKTGATADDRLIILGFSRGAYAARVLAGFIHNFGLIPPDELHLITQVFRAYREISHEKPGTPPDEVFASLRRYQSVLRSYPAPIKFLGLFDTVSSMIRVQFRAFFKTGSILKFGTHASVNSNASVEILRHALSIDEARSMFRSQLWEEGQEFYGNPYKRGTPKAQDIKQVWFAGTHKDIGGSVPEDQSGISKLTFMWMKEQIDAIDVPKAQKVSFRDRYIKKYILGEETAVRTTKQRAIGKPDYRGKIHNTMKGAWLLFEIFPKSKVRLQRPYRRGIIYYIPWGEPRPIPADGELHESATKRLADPDMNYNPRNIVRAKL